MISIYDVNYFILSNIYLFFIDFCYQLTWTNLTIQAQCSRPFFLSFFSFFFKSCLPVLLYATKNIGSKLKFGGTRTYHHSINNFN